ncbi:hypothetical protein J2X46_002684 [Nocardioides sp. BE266]|nr:hypothetical protein [Nocardioides sp. BE266]
MSARQFYLTVVGVNWGRGYEPGVFMRNVRNVMAKVDDHQHYVILPQELDEEPDPAHEHDRLASALEPGTRKVYWPTREPIILSPGFKVTKRKRVKIMGSGLEIGAAKGTGPARHISTCVAELKGIELFFGNWHPHRSGLNAKVDEARDSGAVIAGETLRSMFCHDGGTSGIYACDYNARRMPRMVPGEKVAHHQGLDHMRFVENEQGARLELKDHGSLEGTIDNHDPIWARFRVSAR